MQYANPSKLQRAQKWATDNGKAGDEATIKARYLVLGGLIIGDTEESDAPTALADMSLPALKKYAKDNEIDLGEATKKDEVLAAIQAAQA